MIKLNDSFFQEFFVDEKVYTGFIDLFKDKNPLHTDSSFAISKGFNAKVMHGNILGGFISYFVGECLPLKNVVIHSQEINYHKAVYLGDKLFFRAKVVDVFESVNVIAFSFLFEREKKEKIAKGKIQIGII